MIAQLSDEERQAMFSGVGARLEICDGDQVYYLTSKAEYEAVRAVLDAAVLDADEIEPSFFEFDDE